MPHHKLQWCALVDPAVSDRSMPLEEGEVGTPSHGSLLTDIHLIRFFSFFTTYKAAYWFPAVYPLWWPSRTKNFLPQPKRGCSALVWWDRRSVLGLYSIMTRWRFSRSRWCRIYFVNYLCFFRVSLCELACDISTLNLILKCVEFMLLGNSLSPWQQPINAQQDNKRIGSNHSGRWPNDGILKVFFFWYGI